MIQISFYFVWETGNGQIRPSHPVAAVFVSACHMTMTTVQLARRHLVWRRAKSMTAKSLVLMSKLSVMYVEHATSSVKDLFTSR